MRKAPLLCLFCMAMLGTPAGRVSEAGVPAPAISPARVALSDVVDRYGYTAPVISLDSFATTSKFSSLVFTSNSRKLLFNGVLVMLNDGALAERGAWTIAVADRDKVLDPLLRTQPALKTVGYSTVVIDPGHGGEDDGMVGVNGLREKTAVLDISKRVEGRLRAAGIAVRMTRYRDVFISLDQRVQRAKDWRADLFVSIHINAAGNRDAAGFETYVVPAAGFRSTTSEDRDGRTYAGNKFDCQNSLLAYYIQKGVLARAPGDDRGVKRARYIVLRDAVCPAALVECGFASNVAEARRLASAAHRDLVADGIARGILTYVSRVREAHLPAAR